MSAYDPLRTFVCDDPERIVDWFKSLQQLQKMDALPQDERDAPAPIGRGAAFVVWSPVIFVVLIQMFDRATLVDPIPLPLTLASAAVGLAAGTWIALKAPLSSSIGEFRRTVGRLALPIFGALGATFLARFAVERVAFVGLSPRGTLVEAHVEDAGTGRYGGQSAEVNFGPGTRSVHVEISAELLHQLLPYRPSRSDCIVLPVETGRFHLRRTVLPRRWFDEPIGKYQYKSTC